MPHRTARRETRRPGLARSTRSVAACARDGSASVTPRRTEGRARAMVMRGRRRRGRGEEEEGEARTRVTRGGRARALGKGGDDDGGDDDAGTTGERATGESLGESVQKIREYVTQRGALAWEMTTVELSAEKAARWPMCLAIAIDKTTRVRAAAVTALAAVFARFLAALETSAAEGGTPVPMAVRKMIVNPLTTFVLCEVNVLLTAFVVLYPATYAQAAIDEREGVEESNTLRSLKLPAIVAEFAVGSKVAMHRLGRVIVRDFALFMTVYLVGVGYFLSLDEDPNFDRATSVHEMPGGISVHSSLF